jgi:dUTP pyrophosphatase
VIYLRWEENHAPRYMTQHSAGADLYSRIDFELVPMQRAAIPTGVWIDRCDPSDSVLYELQIRARSGLAFKHGVQLANGVGTIDADYRDEICVLLINLGDKPFVIKKGDRIAQLLLAEVKRLKQLDVGGLRQGGFGSTDTKTL